MKLLLLSMGLVLVCGFQPEYSRSEEDLSDEKEQKWLSGHWDTVVLASSDISLIQEEGPFRTFVQNITVENGNLNGFLWTRKNGRCIPLYLTAFKTKEARHFKMDYYGTNDVYYESSKPNEYAIIILYNYHDGKVNIVSQLFGRTPYLSNEIKKRFEEDFINRGFRRENILDVSEVDHC